MNGRSRPWFLTALSLVAFDAFWLGHYATKGQAWDAAFFGGLLVVALAITLALSNREVPQ